MEDHVHELKKKIRILEWDKDLNQINFSKVKKLQELKKELETLEKPVPDN